MLLWFIYICGAVGAACACYEDEMSPSGHGRKFTGDVFILLILVSLFWPMIVTNHILKEK